MRLIDADAAVAEWYRINDIDEDDRGARFIGYTEIPRWLNHIPTIDAEPVVHCKECKQYHIAWGGRGFCMGDKSISGIVNDNDYCSYGERREP